jgi:hypothetical protein
VITEVDVPSHKMPHEAVVPLRDSHPTPEHERGCSLTMVYLPWSPFVSCATLGFLPCGAKGSAPQSCGQHCTIAEYLSSFLIHPNIVSGPLSHWPWLLLDSASVPVSPSLSKSPNCDMFCLPRHPNSAHVETRLLTTRLCQFSLQMFYNFVILSKDFILPKRKIP